MKALNFKKLIACGLVSSLLLCAVTFAGCKQNEEGNGSFSKVTESESGDEGNNSSVTGEWQPGLEAESRPTENMEIPFEKTLLSKIFDNVDKYHLYIRARQHTLSFTGYTTHSLEYAFQGVKVYMHHLVNGDELHYYSDGKSLYGLDFEDKTYTLIAPSTYTVDEILYMGDFAFCTNTGKDLFLGEELTYEDYSNTNTEWIRYYFKDNGDIAGYERYDRETDEILEITCYEAFTSEFPEDVTLHFDIPAGFKLYSDVIEYSDLFGDEY